jgi:hypothetical protein
MKKKILGIAVLGLGIASFAGCKKDNAEDMYPLDSNTCDTIDVTYSAIIQPIMAGNCATAGCHYGAGATGYDLSTYAGVKIVATNGNLMESIKHTGYASAMPKDAPKLDDCTIAKIGAWVNAGALNN